jgi:hypothetical protein
MLGDLQRFFHNKGGISNLPMIGAKPAKNSGFAAYHQQL